MSRSTGHTGKKPTKIRRSTVGPKRAHKRYAVDWRVSLRCPDWRFVGNVAATNASQGGMFIVTSRPPAVGSAIELTLALPDGSTLRLRGTVKHIVTVERAQSEGRSPGVGVAIDPAHEIDLVLLREMARAETAAAPKKARAERPRESRETQLRRPPARASTLRPRRPSGNVAGAVGIDFGTTNTSISVAIGGQIWLIPDAQGRTLHPSLVRYSERGEPLVGWPARERAGDDPRRTISSIKRLLGRAYSDPSVGGHLQCAPYKTIPGPNDTILCDVEGRAYAAPQVCAAILAHVRDLAEKWLGVGATPIRQAVLSVPVSFREPQKLALRKAARIAGLEVLDLIEEPTAGVLAYGLGQGRNEIVAVYDFGGGTFDFTVLDVSGDRFRKLASDGDPWLGGDDFDLALAQFIADAFWKSTKVELRQRVVEWQRLLVACEQAKRTLSEQLKATVMVRDMITVPRKLDVRHGIARGAFETLCTQFFERSIDICRGVLARAGLDPSDVTQVVVTGGTSRAPFVRAGLARFFEREIASVVHPDEAICVGTGLHAAMLAGHQIAVKARRLGA